MSAKLTVLAGPTAVGKGTVVARLRELYPNLYVSISATTRNPRPGEEDGKDYYFVNQHRFDQLVRDGKMQRSDWSSDVYSSDLYGTPAEPVDNALSEGRAVLVEIDLAGARQIRQKRPDAQLVFLLPPSWEELVSRLRGRGTEDELEQTRRLQTAKVELAAADEFDVQIVNDEVNTAVSKLASVMGLA